ncbi:DUF427 domain-containing protein [Herbiconiux sp. L3-i23]|uniref:DUF427 domain-containing protein n=1 Tax=Herbiconiux sp. L3-i23 TaxID=2905871 RepID=UPI00205C5345|nr:DUF427 domain-containing protein [Herbiconiux sp. L3-i23]BDI23565.1 hypothetical protein L3i23_23410 [Herbiconiux sp. L3-i23]
MRTRHPKPDPIRSGQESVWDYPRPPRVEPTTEEIVIVLGGQVVARSNRAVRVLETSHPPVYYLPADDFADGALRTAPGASWCEYKGEAGYLDVVAGDVVAAGAGWTYPDPSHGFERLQGMVAVYPGKVDRVTVGGEVVRPQAGGFYGGWITDRVVGPFKGEPGTAGW